jgi:hypothetical protein
MMGTIEVGEQTTTTGTGPGGATTGAGTTATMTMPMNMPMPVPTTSTSQKSALSPIVGTAGSAIKIAGAKAGKQIDGSLKISQAGRGGHAVIAVVASSAALQGGRSKQAVTLGHIRINNLRPGTAAFKVALKSSARRALTAHRRLPITVQITIAAAGAETVTTSRSLVLLA